MRANAIALMAAAVAMFSATSAIANQANDLISPFKAVCLGGAINPKAELARADALGWRSSGRDAPKGFDPTTQRLSPSTGSGLVLSTAENVSAGETHDFCGISSLTPVEALVGATQAWLGFAPIFAMQGSATFAGLRTGNSWRPSPKLDRAALDTVKREGSLYSIMVLNNGTSSTDGGYAATIAFLRARQTS